MKWLTNIYNPDLPDAKDNYVYTTSDRDMEWKQYLNFLSDKIIGQPTPTKVFTVEQLTNMSMVGVYSNE